MRRSSFLALALSIALSIGLVPALIAPSAASPPSDSKHGPPRVLIVDDDGAQCGRHAYPNIGSAVEAAHSGDRISICPGRYAERVIIDKSLTLTGRPDAVAALDCFAEQPSDPHELDITALPVLEPPDEEETPVLRVAADRVEVSGLVIQGVDDRVADDVDGYTLFDAALTTDDPHSGWRIHHNLFRLNFLAAELGSDGARLSRFDHNCLRDNEFAGANQRYALERALLDHNRTFRSGTTAWEIGWGYRGTARVALERNTSQQDKLWVYAQNDDRLSLRGNVVHQAGIGIRVAGGDTDTKIIRNTLQGTTAGAAILVSPQAEAPVVSRLVVRGNTMVEGVFSGFTTALADLTGAEITHNTSSRNQRSGLILSPGAHDNRMVGNITEDNLQYGIRMFAGAEGNLIKGNRMLRNGLADALDETATTTDGITVLANRWVRNTCTTDVPASAIC